MLYLVAILLPPLAVLLCGKPFQALINIPLTLLGIIPGWIHALFVVHNFYADGRTGRMLKAMEEQQRLQALQLKQDQLQLDRERVEAERRRQEG